MSVAFFAAMNNSTATKLEAWIDTDDTLHSILALGSITLSHVLADRLAAPDLTRYSRREAGETSLLHVGTEDPNICVARGGTR